MLCLFKSYHLKYWPDWSPWVESKRSAWYQGKGTEFLGWCFTHGSSMFYRRLFNVLPTALQCFTHSSSMFHPRLFNVLPTALKWEGFHQAQFAFLFITWTARLNPAQPYFTPSYPDLFFVSFQINGMTWVTSDISGKVSVIFALDQDQDYIKTIQSKS